MSDYWCQTIRCPTTWCQTIRCPITWWRTIRCPTTWRRTIRCPTTWCRAIRCQATLKLTGCRRGFWTLWCQNGCVSWSTWTAVCQSFGHGWVSDFWPWIDIHRVNIKLGVSDSENFGCHGLVLTVNPFLNSWCRILAFTLTGLWNTGLWDTGQGIYIDRTFKHGALRYWPRHLHWQDFQTRCCGILAMLAFTLTGLPNTGLWDTGHDIYIDRTFKHGAVGYWPRHLHWQDFQTRGCGILAKAFTLTGLSNTGLWDTETRMWTECAQLVWSVRLAADTILLIGASAV